MVFFLRQEMQRKHFQNNPENFLAAAVEYTGSREGTTLGFAFTLMDGLGAFGALLAGWAAGIQFSHAFLLAGVLCTFSLILCFSVSLRSTRMAPAV